jgi:hypothetical protein
VGFIGHAAAIAFRMHAGSSMLKASMRHARAITCSVNAVKGMFGFCAKGVGSIEARSCESV